MAELRESENGHLDADLRIESRAESGFWLICELGSDVLPCLVRPGCGRVHRASKDCGKRSKPLATGLVDCQDAHFSDQAEGKFA